MGPDIYIDWLLLSIDQESPGALRTTHPTHGRGRRWSIWLWKINLVENPAKGPCKDGQSRQTVRDESEGHATNAAAWFDRYGYQRVE